MELLKRHSWFLAAAGVCSLVAAGMPLLAHFMSGAAAKAVAPGSVEIAAFVIFGLALSASMFDRSGSTSRRWISLAVQSLAVLVISIHDTNVVIFPLLVMVAWQAALMMPLYAALAWVLTLTALLISVPQPLWQNPACLLMLGIFLAFQFFGFFAARVVRDEASHAQELARVNAELRATRALLAATVRTEERVRISRDLHDAWGHHLTALNLQLEYASHLASGTVRENMDEAKDLSRALLAKVRDVVGTLNIHERCDITTMLRELVSGLPQPAVHLNLPQNLQAQSAAHAQVILRCVQEIVTNAIKHAHAKNLWIDIQQQPDGLRIAARDDGRGAAVLEPGNGLNGMCGRFEALGGKLQVATAAGQGFSLDAWLPQAALS